MNLSEPLKKEYGQERHSALEAQKIAHRIAFAPVIFQVSRLMIRFGILEYLSEHREGSTMKEIGEATGLSDYAVKILMEASLSIGSVLVDGDRFTISKTGWFLLNDSMVRTNMNFNQDVNYNGMFFLEEALLNGKPEGLKVFGDWPTLYEGLSSLPEDVRKSWFEFDHFYSDRSFDAALKAIFEHGQQIKTLLDVGGNTGKWALRCVGFDKDVHVTVMDLPQQIEMMKRFTSGKKGADRISGYRADLLNEDTVFPSPAPDIIWMSQFLDCFSEPQITSICRRAAASMDAHSRLYVMETFWDRQRFETAAFCLTQTSVYFTAMANGNSKMYRSDDMIRCIGEAGLEVEEIIDGLGLGHSILICRKKR